MHAYNVVDNKLTPV